MVKPPGFFFFLAHSRSSCTEMVKHSQEVGSGTTLQLNTFEKTLQGCFPAAQFNFPKELYTTSVLSTSDIVLVGPAASCPVGAKDKFWEILKAGCRFLCPLDTRGTSFYLA